MVRSDNSDFLLFIEPRSKEHFSKEPINDEWTVLMEEAMKKAKLGTAEYSGEEGDPSRFQENCAWRGIHVCACGAGGGNKEFLLENGMITNYLAVHYLQHHRGEIPERDWKMLKDLKDFYSKPNNEKLNHIKTFEKFNNKF